MVVSQKIDRKDDLQRTPMSRTLVSAREKVRLDAGTDNLPS
jgi:hypothetical protein